MNNEFSKEDRELLIRIDERTKTFEQQMTNHLVHHFRYSILAWAVTIGAIVSLILIIVKTP